MINPVHAKIEQLHHDLASAEGFVLNAGYGDRVDSSSGVYWTDENGENPVSVMMHSRNGEAGIFLFNSNTDTGVRIYGEGNEFTGVETCTADMDLLRCWLRLSRLMLEG